MSLCFYCSAGSCRWKRNWCSSTFRWLADLGFCKGYKCKLFCALCYDSLFMKIMKILFRPVLSGFLCFSLPDPHLLLCVSFPSEIFCFLREQLKEFAFLIDLSNETLVCSETGRHLSGGCLHWEKDQSLQSKCAQRLCFSERPSVSPSLLHEADCFHAYMPHCISVDHYTTSVVSCLHWRHKWMSRNQQQLFSFRHFLQWLWFLSVL